MKQYPGNTLTEYGVVLSVVAMLALMALQFLGQSISGNLLSAVSSTASKAQGGAPGTLGLLNPVNVEKESESNQVCMGAGKCIELSPMIPDTSIATAGSLGSDMVTQMAQILGQMKQELEEGGTDPAIVDLVSQLAEQGHSMGNLHQEIADNMQVCTNGTLICNNNSAVFNSTLNGENRLLTMRDSLYSKYNQLNDYLEKNPETLQDFPGANGIIRYEVQQIGVLAKNASPGIYGINKNSFGINPTRLMQGIEVQDAAKLTHISSNSICDQGGKDCKL